MGSVLITGGTGFIGSHLGEKLVGKYDNIIVVDNLYRGNLEMNNIP